jgi:5-methylcytosine-specific restriction protein A
MPIAPRRACLHPGCLAYAETVGRCATHAAPVLLEREQRRSRTPGRAWYFTPRWQALRRAVLRAEPLCRACHAAGIVRAGVDVDHIVAHRGDPRRFWDRENLQPLCKACHDAKTATERRTRAQDGRS